ncbi:MAG: DegT/DnrJ/EryC1/StrS family aminotransferase [Armatimonadota bacterium]|nr:DegT/DnrJ/EryC1/StrS family aminotransferase [Armatimonadota bacterium]
MAIDSSVVNGKLAIDGGAPAKTTPNIPMYPGGLSIGEEEKKLVMEVLDNKYLFRYYGPADCPSKVRELEVQWAEKMGVKYALAVNSCTSALISSLTALGVGPGSEVIVPGYTFFASCASIVGAKAIPIIAEVDKSLTLDPADVEKKITDRTKAIIAVHMRGVPCKMDELMAISKKYNVPILEDVAQACGGSYKGKRLGSFGDCNAYSLQYHKIITSGEGGIVTTNDELLYDRAQAYHDTAACWRPDRFGLPRYEGEVFPGVNFRMSELHGAVALAQLGKLDNLLAQMRHNKARIKSQITGIDGIEFRELNDADGDTAISLVLFLPDEATTRKFAPALKAEGVEAGCIFDKGVPDWHIYAHWKMIIDKVTATPEGCPYTCSYYKGPVPTYSPDMNPNTLNILGKTIHMDIPAQITDQDCDMIATAIHKVAKAYL